MANSFANVVQFYACEYEIKIDHRSLKKRMSSKIALSASSSQYSDGAIAIIDLTLNKLT